MAEMTLRVLNYQTWLICGGREFADQVMFDAVMDDLTRARGCPSRIVHGAVSGADSMAGEFGRRMALEVVAVPADWNAHGKAAGPIRNQQMLERHAVDLVVAFPGGSGTADMVKRARRAGITVAEVQPLPPPPDLRSQGGE